MEKNSYIDFSRVPTKTPVIVEWKDVWVGASVTSVLFTLGKYLLGLYLGRKGTGSVYGAAGSLVLLLIWIYYSSQLVLLGAEFTKVYARKFGSRIVPDDNSMLIGSKDQLNP